MVRGGNIPTASDRRRIESRRFTGPSIWHHLLRTAEISGPRQRGIDGRGDKGKREGSSCHKFARRWDATSRRADAARMPPRREGSLKRPASNDRSLLSAPRRPNRRSRISPHGRGVKEGKVRHIALSEAGPEQSAAPMRSSDRRAASEFALGARRGNDILPVCRDLGIGSCNKNARPLLRAITEQAASRPRLAAKRKRYSDDNSARIQDRRLVRAVATATASASSNGLDWLMAQGDETSPSRRQAPSRSRKRPRPCGIERR